MFIAPQDGIGRITMFGLGTRIFGIICLETGCVVRVTLVGKYVSGVVEHDIEDDIDT